MSRDNSTAWDQVNNNSTDFLINLTFINAGIRNIPDSGCLHDVSDHKLLDGLVLGDTSGTVCAAHILDMASAFLVASVISSLHSLHRKMQAYILQSC